MKLHSWCTWYTNVIMYRYDLIPTNSIQQHDIIYKLYTDTNDAYNLVCNLKTIYLAIGFNYVTFLNSLIYCDLTFCWT